MWVVNLVILNSVTERTIHSVNGQEKIAWFTKKTVVGHGRNEQPRITFNVSTNNRNKRLNKRLDIFHIDVRFYLCPPAAINASLRGQEFRRHLGFGDTVERNAVWSHCARNLNEAIIKTKPRIMHGIHKKEEEWRRRQRTANNENNLRRMGHYQRWPQLKQEKHKNVKEKNSIFYYKLSEKTKNDSDDKAMEKNKNK